MKRRHPRGTRTLQDSPAISLPRSARLGAFSRFECTRCSRVASGNYPRRSSRSFLIPRLGPLPRTSSIGTGVRAYISKPVVTAPPRHYLSHASAPIFIGEVIHEASSSSLLFLYLPWAHDERAFAGIRGNETLLFLFVLLKLVFSMIFRI